MDNGSVLAGYCATGTFFFLWLCRSLVQRAGFRMNAIYRGAVADRLSRLRLFCFLVIFCGRCLITALIVGMLLQCAGQLFRITAIIMGVPGRFLLRAYQDTLGGITALTMGMGFILCQRTSQFLTLLIAAFTMGVCSGTKLQPARWCL